MKNYKKFCIRTFGCQMNKNDSERIAGLLTNLGWIACNEPEEANLVILNTCSVRDKAERRVIGQFHALNHDRTKSGKTVEFAIAGCMPQHAKEEISKQLPFLDYIVGSNNFEDLASYLDQKPSLQEQLSRLKESRNADYLERYEKELEYQIREETQDAWVSIMFGCDNFCTYCIVPYTRGREISRKKEDIFDELRLIVKQGYNRVVLLGQNVNSYGKKLYTDYFFPNLLEEISKTFPELTEIRFLTSHPYDVNPHLIDVIATHDNLIKEIHFPLQHGDDEILKKMNRKYTYADYKEKVELIRKRIPEIRIGTDLIVGFPGETEKQFQNTMRAVREIKFDFANTAAYSQRPGTIASDFENQIDEKIKNQRLNELNDLLNSMLKGKVAPTVYN